jgi:hypothetical protein
MLRLARPAGTGRALLSVDFSDRRRWRGVDGAEPAWGDKAHPGLTFALGGDENSGAAVCSRVVRLKEAGSIELGAILSTEHASAAVNLVAAGAPDKTISLRCRGRDGSMRIWGGVVAAPGEYRLLLQGVLAGGKVGRVTFRRIEVRRSKPQQFEPRGPTGAVSLPRPVAAERVEIRTFLLSADGKLTPSFRGYQLKLK